MPLSQSLSEVAKLYQFRRMLPDEPEAKYRELLAQRIEGFDRIAAQEVRLGKPWDSWTTEERERFL